MIVDLPESVSYSPLMGYDPELKAEQFLVLFEGQIVLSSTNSWLWGREEFTGYETSQAIVVGHLDSTSIGFAELCYLPEGYEVISPRQLLTMTSETTFGLLSHGLQILTSRKEHRFCGYCGTENKAEAGEWAMVCPGCGHHAYPRISPCIIVVVKKGDEYLLVQHNRHGKTSTMHTVVAGFVEPGESAEVAVSRELMEETGIKVRNIRYCFSQSWPFPHSLMMGFHAEYESGELVIDNKELCFAGWFHKDHLPQLPPKFTISRQLIDL